VTGQLAPGYTLVILADGRVSGGLPVPFTSLPATTNGFPPFAGFNGRTAVSVYLCKVWTGSFGTSECRINPAAGGIFWSP